MAWLSKQMSLNHGTPNMIILQQVQNKASQTLSNHTPNKFIAKNHFK